MLRELTGFTEVLPVHQGRADGGNVDIDALREQFAVEDVACVVLTVTDNAGGGRPVSMRNIRDARAICDEFGVPLILDAARFAENAYLITELDPRYANSSPRAVAEEMFRLADICWAGLKKDGIANIGGMIVMNDPELAARCRKELIAYEGFPLRWACRARSGGAGPGTPGGHRPGILAIPRGSGAVVRRGTRQSGTHRAAADRLPRGLCGRGPTVSAHSGEQVARQRAALRAVSRGRHPASELGTLAFGRVDPDGGPDIPAPRELVRFCLPRRVYTQSHLAYVVEAAAWIAERAHTVTGYRIAEQAKTLRHFTARLEPVHR